MQHVPAAVHIWLWCLLAPGLRLTGALVQMSDAVEEHIPPRLITPSRRTVWFSVARDEMHTVKKFRLECDATGYPAVHYEWFKDGEPFSDGEIGIKRIRPSQSGTIEFQNPQDKDAGNYQCRATNIFGTAVSDVYVVRPGVLDIFPPKQRQTLTVYEGDSLTLPCSPPYGNPKPSIIWMLRNTVQTFVMETIDKEHITVDGIGNLRFSYVKQFDGRENIVYQCHATSPVLQGETRAGNEVILNVIPKALEPRDTELMWGSPDKSNVTAGDTLRLMCIFSTSPPLPTVSWSKDGSDLPKGRLKTEHFGKMIVIEAVRPEDDGVYVCRMHGVQHRMHVHVTAAPYWRDNVPVDQTLPEDASAELHCNALGDPLPDIFWTKNAKPLGPDLRKRIEISEDGQIFRIAKLNHDVDRAVYQCNASNPFGYAFTNMYLNVLAHPPQIAEKNLVVKALRGKDISLDCVVDAAPIASVRWISRDFTPVLVTNKYEILANNSMMIKNVYFTDGGTYVCNVTNKYGTNSATRVLEVFNPTRWVVELDRDGRDELVKERDDVIDLTCSVEADAGVNPRYVWLKDDKLFQLDRDDVRLTTSNTLRISDARANHTGTYTCRAVTDVDMLESKLKLIVKDVPEPPVDVEIDCSNQRKATIRWKPPFSNFDPVKEYIVERHTGFYPGRWDKILTETETATASFEAIHYLSYWVNYTFRVVAVNAYGRSEPAYNNVSCNTPQSSPIKSPTAVKAQGTEPDNLVISWTPMDKMDWNGEKFHYKVWWRLDDAEDTNHSRNIEDPYENHTIIHDQETFRRYKVKVIAHNVHGQSLQEPDWVLGYSGEAEPTDAPMRVLASAMNATTVRVSWDVVSLGSVRGHFQGYKIRSCHILSDSSCKPLPDFLVQPPPETQKHVTVDVNEYRAMQKYKITVLAYNNKYDGPESETAEVVLMQGPPTPVRNLQALSVGARAVLVTWSDPAEYNGILAGYRVNYAEIMSDKRISMFVNTPSQHHLVENLSPDVEYVVSVQAESGGGIGAAVKVTVTTWSQNTRPSKPDLSVEMLNSTAVQLHWMRQQRGLSGYTFYVNYSVANTDRWHQTKEVRLPQTSVNLTDLKENTEYYAHLVAKDNELFTASDLKTFSTVNHTMSEKLMPIYQPLTSATWFIAVLCALIIAVVSIFLICVCQRTRGGKYPVKKKELERGHHLDNDEEKSFMEYQYGVGGREDTNTSPVS